MVLKGLQRLVAEILRVLLQVERDQVRFRRTLPPGWHDHQAVQRHGGDGSALDMRQASYHVDVVTRHDSRVVGQYCHALLRSACMTSKVSTILRYSTRFASFLLRVAQMHQHREEQNKYKTTGHSGMPDIRRGRFVIDSAWPIVVWQRRWSLCARHAGTHGTNTATDERF